MMESNRSMIIFADVQQENPEYLCMDTSGELYLCTVEQQNGGFVERIIKKCHVLRLKFLLQMPVIKPEGLFLKVESLKETGSRNE